MPETKSTDEILRHCLKAALEAADPGTRLAVALEHETWQERPTWFLAVGKGAVRMSEAILEWAAEHDHSFDGGLIVQPRGLDSRVGEFEVRAGDHPVPGPNSFKAAAAIGEFIARVPGNALVHVLVSGGASSLIAGPLEDISETDLTAAFRTLLTSGFSIDEMNAIRKRFTRWSAGRLAAALTPRDVDVWLVSDVIGDDPGTIASGPCHGDRWRADEVLSLLRERSVTLPPPIAMSIPAETLKPGDSIFAKVRTTLVANNQSALDGAVAAAATLGIPQRRFATQLEGEARDAGRALATEAIRIAREWSAQNDQLREERGPGWTRPLLLYQGGETTVSISENSGEGGRSLEVALAAAEMLEVSPHSIALLAAGTDGRDGNSDAAGAIVTETSWEAIQKMGIDPAESLATHDAASGLRAIDAQIITGPTGGNVADVVMCVIGL